MSRCRKATFVTMSVSTALIALFAFVVFAIIGSCQADRTLGKQEFTNVLESRGIPVGSMAYDTAVLMCHSENGREQAEALGRLALSSEDDIRFYVEAVMHTC